MEAVTQIERFCAPNTHEYEPLTPYVALQLGIINGAEHSTLNTHFDTQEERRQFETELAAYSKVREMFRAKLGAYPEDLPKGSGDPVDKLRNKLFLP